MGLLSARARPSVLQKFHKETNQEYTQLFKYFRAKSKLDPHRAAYPDMSLEIISSGDTGRGLVATQWVLHGTRTGPLMDGTSPTGRTVAYPGASFTQIEGDKIRSEHVYVDRQTVAEQLGLKAK
jgi:predicted ester cyclase